MTKNKKQKIILHVCCAPCATAVREILDNGYEIEFFFSNSNIYPREEYDKRLAEVQKLADKFKINLIIGDYDHDDWKKAIIGKENLPENSARCEICFKKRLEETAKLAKNKKENLFTTTLTISPHKNYNLINKIGLDIAKIFNVNFLDKDFKKNNGYQRSLELSKEFNLYRQNYCGCEYSINNKIAKRAK